MTTATRSTCRSCRAPIVWALTSKGRLMPIDADPVDGGNISLVEITTMQDWEPRLMAVVHPERQASLLDDGEQHVAHFTTCPQADEHRRPRTTRVGEWGLE